MGKICSSVVKLNNGLKIQTFDPTIWLYLMNMREHRHEDKDVGTRSHNRQWDPHALSPLFHIKPVFYSQGDGSDMYRVTEQEDRRLTVHGEQEHSLVMGEHRKSGECLNRGQARQSSHCSSWWLDNATDEDGGMVNLFQDLALKCGIRVLCIRTDNCPFLKVENESLKVQMQITVSCDTTTQFKPKVTCQLGKYALDVDYPPRNRIYRGSSSSLSRHFSKESVDTLRESLERTPNKAWKDL
ncbi:hypothetical protein Tco_1316888 [Tanacetum coccineum]